jgi:PAS domain S-box-containing protein
MDVSEHDGGENAAGKNSNLSLTRVLLVEDTGVYARLIERLLDQSHRFPCRLEHARSIAEAVDRLRAGGVDVILLDLSLREVEGMDLLMRVKGLAPGVPIVVLTALDDDAVAIQAVRQGAQDYVVKGRVSTALLVRSIRQAIERKRTEEELQSASAEIQHLVAAIPSILLSVDESLNVTRWNGAAERAFGVSASEAVGKPLDQCAAPWDTHRVVSHVQKCLQRVTQVSCDNVRFRTQSGQDGILAFTASPIVKPGKPCAGSLLQMSDITQRRALEVQLAQAQKLESIGRLASGIAHEINTPIQYVTDNIRFLNESFGGFLKLLETYRELHQAVSAGACRPDLIDKVSAQVSATDLDFLMQEVPTAVKQSLEGLDRVTKIVRAVKDFSHPGGQEKVAVDVHRAIESTIVVARNEWKYVADVVTAFDQSLPMIWLYPDEFNQVILNLIVNAGHAIGEAIKKGLQRKGTITIRTRKIGVWVEIDIQDTGTGIPDNIRDRIFEPFFTTMEVGKGTGQGLSMAYATIVKRHSGSITFDSKPNEGTTFRIRLPMSTSSIIVKTAPPAVVHNASP